MTSDQNQPAAEVRELLTPAPQPAAVNPTDVRTLALQTWSYLEYLGDLGFDFLIPHCDKQPLSRAQTASRRAAEAKPSRPASGAAQSDYPWPRDVSPGPERYPKADHSDHAGGSASTSEPQWARGAGRPPTGPDFYKPSYRPSAQAASSKAPQPEQSWLSNAGSLMELYQGLEDCRMCLLANERHKVFPGRGPIGAKVMFVVEPPSLAEREADEQPVGAMGELLNNIIVKGLKLSLDECFITSLVKCPVEDPEDSEVINLKPCTSIVLKEIELAAPKAVVALGLLPGRALSGAHRPMGLLRIRKMTLSSDRIPFRITYGLKAMFDEPLIKREVWEDLKKFLMTSRS
ncbi:MAG: uracil-DNA glycosylase [Deltaproteobacteria bacterium]|jgi:DNA polymerase|nr:uracil-DNA glycosylase [Deltaproteobacteria bacterium]